MAATKNTSSTSSSKGSQGKMNRSEAGKLGGQAFHAKRGDHGSDSKTQGSTS